MPDEWHLYSRQPHRDEADLKGSKSRANFSFGIEYILLLFHSTFCFTVRHLKIFYFITSSYRRKIHIHIKVHIMIQNINKLIESSVIIKQNKNEFWKFEDIFRSESY